MPPLIYAFLVLRVSRGSVCGLFTSFVPCYPPPFFSLPAAEDEHPLHGSNTGTWRPTKGSSHERTSPQI